MTITPELTSGQREQVRGLLSRCVVQVKVGQETGTGFFVAPGQVLTCRHVVASAIPPRSGQISVLWWRDAGSGPVTLGATLLEDPPPDWPDIAVLQVPGAEDGPCPILDASAVDSGTPLLTAGYPTGALVIFQPQQFTAGYLGHDEANRIALRLTGDMVRPGMSGSPIISLKSGFAVGIMHLTKGSDTTAGGFGMLLANIAESVPSLLPLTDRPPVTAREWLGILTPVQLKEADRDRRTGARNVQRSLLPRVDLIVEQAGPGQDWQIGLRTARIQEAPQPIPRRAADLGNDVIRAVDGWSRHQSIRQQEDLRALGSVLDRALLPVEAKTVMDEALRGQKLLLRVCVDKAGGLSQLPWEYACGDGSQPLSVDPRIIFARFVDVPSELPPVKDALRVLTIVDMPEAEARKWNRGYPNESSEMIYPKAKEFAATVNGSFYDKRRIDFSYLCNGSIDDVRDKLYEGWDIVHYIGFAWHARELVISLGCGDRPDSELTPVGVGELAEYLADSRCSVFIAEFHKLAPGSTARAPADLGRFAELLKGGLQAIVVTRHPVDIVDFRRFNGVFYGAVAKGESVEGAVQQGRANVKKRYDFEDADVDAISFGSFTVTTRQAGEVRLLTPVRSGGPPGLGSGERPPLGQRAELSAPVAEDTASVSGG